jgi:chemotaxis protein MotB
LILLDFNKGLCYRKKACANRKLKEEYMARSRVLYTGILFLAGIILFNLTGCTIIFQKGRKSDEEKIQSLQEEVDRLSQIQAELEKKLKGIEGVSLNMEDRGLVITFLDEVLFDSGKTKIKSEAYPALDQVADVITAKAADLNVGIEGHTDNEPIKYSGWKSNWELSTARATSVLHYLVEKGVVPEKLAATGYGEYRPVVSNDTPEGRRKNRRVEIVIVPKLKKVSKEGGAAEPAQTKTAAGLIEPKENLK